jgi:hypothetical protein
MFEAGIPLDFIDMPVGTHEEYRGLLLPVALFSPPGRNWIASLTVSLFS